VGLVSLHPESCTEYRYYQPIKKEVARNASFKNKLQCRNLPTKKKSGNESLEIVSTPDEGAISTEALQTNNSLHN